MNRYEFIVVARKWFDKINGNTYHAVKVVRVADGKEEKSRKTYGYGNQFEVTAQVVLTEKFGVCENFVREKYSSIYWVIEPDCKKRDLDF